MSRLRLMLATPVAFAGCIPHFASAQDTTPTALAPIIVDGGNTADSEADVQGYVAKSSSTASKSGAALIETPQSVSVVTQDQIEAQGAQTLGDVLSYTPGVVAEPFGADPRFDSPIIRGFDGATYSSSMVCA